MSHHHLTVEEREIIAFMHAKGHPQVEIATAVNKSQSTISRELHRNEMGDTVLLRPSGKPGGVVEGPIRYGVGSWIILCCVPMSVGV
jgi:hypothetical protein